MIYAERVHVVLLQSHLWLEALILHRDVLIPHKTLAPAS